MAQELASIRYGPNLAPLFNCLGQCTLIIPANRPRHLEIGRYILTLLAPVLSKVSIVDIPDLAGTTALAHSISTKPCLDTEYAQMLWEAGANVNHRNRYGATPAVEICMVWKPEDKALVASAGRALEWFLSHGGNIDLADGDGATPRRLCETLKKRRVGLDVILAKHEAQREKRKNAAKINQCLACADQEGKILQCARCKKAGYCAPPKACQKVSF